MHTKKSPDQRKNNHGSIFCGPYQHIKIIIFNQKFNFQKIELCAKLMKSNQGQISFDVKLVKQGDLHSETSYFYDTKPSSSPRKKNQEVLKSFVVTLQLYNHTQKTKHQNCSANFEIVNSPYILASLAEKTSKPSARTCTN